MPSPSQPVPAASTAAPMALGYRPALDGVRTFAVLLVVAVHASYVLVPEWGGRWVPGGFLGVDIFFVLSGLLITTILLEEHDRTGGVAMKSFYARRALRLLPAVGVMLLTLAVLDAWFGVDLGVQLHTTGAAALYGLNWVIAGGEPVGGAIGHLWSLSVEAQFYLVWPVLLLIALRRRRPTRAIVAIAGAGILWATGVRALLWLHVADWQRIYVRTDARADELLAGVLLAVAFRSGWRLPPRWRYLGPASLSVLVLCSLTVRRENSWLFVGGGFTLVALAAVLLLASVLDREAPLARAFSWPPAVRLGRASFSLYLWHLPVFVIVGGRLETQPAGIRLIVGLVGCGLATVASFWFVEQPVARLRRRWANERTSTMVPAGASDDPGGNRPPEDRGTPPP